MPTMQTGVSHVRTRPFARSDPSVASRQSSASQREPPAAREIGFAAGELAVVAGGEIRHATSGREQPLFTFVRAATKAAVAFVVGEIEVVGVTLGDTGRA